MMDEPKPRRPARSCPRRHHPTIPHRLALTTVLVLLCLLLDVDCMPSSFPATSPSQPSSNFLPTPSSSSNLGATKSSSGPSSDPVTGDASSGDQALCVPCTASLSSVGPALTSRLPGLCVLDTLSLFCPTSRQQSTHQWQLTAIQCRQGNSTADQHQWHAVSKVSSRVGDLSSCTLTNCSGLQIANALLLSNATDSNTSITVVCDEGYVLQGSDPTAPLVCDRAGKWQGNIPYCRPAMCRPYNSSGSGVDSVVPVRSNYTLGDNITLTCTAGHVFKYGAGHGTSAVLSCAGENDWRFQDSNVTQPVCLPVQCQEVFNSTALVVEVTNLFYEYGTTVNFSCSDGHDLVGATSAKCLANGSWSAPSPLCQPRDCGEDFDQSTGSASQPCTAGCGPPNATDNGSFNGTFEIGGYVFYSCDEGFRLNTPQGSSAVIVCEETGMWNASAPECVSTPPDSSSSSMLVIILVPVLAGTLVLAAAVLLICRCCVPRLGKKQRRDSQASLLPGHKPSAKGRQQTATHSWVYDQRQDMTGVAVVLPGHGLSSSLPRDASTWDPRRSTSHVPLVAGGAESALGSRTISRMQSATTLETSLTYERGETGDDLQFSEDQLALFAKSGESKSAQQNGAENTLAGELDEIMKRRPSKRSRKSGRHSHPGSESEGSSSHLHLAPGDTLSSVGSAGVRKKSSLSRGVAAAAAASGDEEDGDHSSTASANAADPKTVDSISPFHVISPAAQAVLAASNSGGEGTPTRGRSSSIMALIQRYDAPKWSKSSPQPSAVRKTERPQSGRSSILTAHSNDDEYSDAYDTPDSLAKQVTHDSPLVSASRQSSHRRRTNSDTLPPLPRQQSKLTWSGSEKRKSTQSIASVDSADVKETTQDADEEVSPYADLKAIRQEVRAVEQLHREKSLQEMLAETSDSETDIDSFAHHAKMQAEGGAAGGTSKKEKKIQPYEDLRAVRKQLELELQEDVMPYARVPRKLSRVGVADEDNEGADAEDDDDDDAKPYARVPQRMSVISTDDRETIDTSKSSFRSSFRWHSIDRVSEDEGISTDGTAVTTRAGESEGSVTELPQLEVIIDQPLREGECTPPYARVRVASKKKRSSATLPPGLVKHDSLGEDSGISNKTWRKTASLRKEAASRKALQDQWSSEESENERGSAQKSRKSRSLPHRVARAAAKKSTEEEEYREADVRLQNTIVLGPLSANPDYIFDSPVATPELPRRSVFSRILDAKGRPERRYVYYDFSET